MSSDEENGPAIYDDDSGDEGNRVSVASARDSYNVGSITEEPKHSDHKEKEKKEHQQEEVTHV